MSEQEATVASGLIPVATDSGDANLVVLHGRGPDLSTISATRREMSRVYRLARRGKLRLSDATRLCYILTKNAELIAMSELEERIHAIEAAVQAHE